MYKDLTGERFGRLVVKELAYHKDWARWWLCICDCGAEKLVKSASLLRRKESTRSCGCLQRETASTISKSTNRKRLPDGEANFNKLYSTYSRNAKIRELPFELDKEDFRELTKQDCYYCGCKPSQVFTNGSKQSPNGYYVYNGIDRLLDDYGYTLINCVACCGTCNKAKNNMDAGVFVDWIKKVHDNLQGRFFS